MDATSEEYLGDGLYVSFDGWHIRLRAPREGGDHWVALEPSVYAALVDYHRRLLVCASASLVEAFVCVHPPKPTE